MACNVMQAGRKGKSVSRQAELGRDKQRGMIKEGHRQG